MPQLHRYRIFVSHAWRHHDAYDRLIKLLDNASNFIYSNYSVAIDKKFDDMSRSQLKDELRDQIRPTECVIVLAGLYVSYSDWIQFEIDFAKTSMKPIVGLQPWGSTRTPAAVAQAANTIVGWNTSSIVDAIRNFSI